MTKIRSITKLFKTVLYCIYFFNYMNIQNVFVRPAVQPAAKCKRTLCAAMVVCVDADAWMRARGGCDWSEESAVLEVILDNDVGDGVEDELDIVGVRRAREV